MSFTETLKSVLEKGSLKLKWSPSQVRVTRRKNVNRQRQNSLTWTDVSAAAQLLRTIKVTSSGSADGIPAEELGQSSYRKYFY